MAELEQLRGAYRAASSPEESHLSDEQWERLACDEMGPGEREAALEHVVSCPECTQLYRGVLALREGAQAFDPAAPPPQVQETPTRAWRWGRWVTGLAAAAAAVVAVFVLRPAGGPVPARPFPSHGVTLRAGGTPEGPVLVAPLGAVPGDPGVLSWRAAEGARGYIVELLDADGELLWRSDEVAGTYTRWPSAVRPAPGRYYWRVLAVPEAGGKPVASGLESFEIGATASSR